MGIMAVCICNKLGNELIAQSVPFPLLKTIIISNISCRIDISNNLSRASNLALSTTLQMGLISLTVALKQEKGEGHEA